mmetsp:Transcript_20180/g.17880  ORF Transcript_20180/g.17880 Transcript_20180/m.17880 type:complete len:228 (-) Transcript_20180:77-760(-)
MTTKTRSTRTSSRLNCNSQKTSTKIRKTSKIVRKTKTTKVKTPLKTAKATRATKKAGVKTRDITTKKRVSTRKVASTKKISTRKAPTSRKVNKSAKKGPTKSVKKGAIKTKNTIPLKFRAYTTTEYAKYKKAEAKYNDMTMVRLKDFLKENRQSRSGNKDVLVTKCSDGETLGATPKCEKCGGGFLRFNQSTNFYKCPGYRDDDDYINCSGFFCRSAVKRSEWQIPS